MKYLKDYVLGTDECSQFVITDEMANLIIRENNKFGPCAAYISYEPWKDVPIIERNLPDTFPHYVMPIK